MPNYYSSPQLLIKPPFRDPFKTAAYIFCARPSSMDAGDFYRQKTRDVQAIIADHIARHLPLRGIGRSSSHSDVGLTDGTVILTEQWTQVFAIQPTDVIDVAYKQLRPCWSKQNCFVQRSVSLRRAGHHALAEFRSWPGAGRLVAIVMVISSKSLFLHTYRGR